MKKNNLATLFIEHIYADHNRSKTIKKTLNLFFKRLEAGALGLNIGSGGNKLGKNIINLDITKKPNIDIIGSAENIPLSDQSVSFIITQETFEHIKDPDKAIHECFRVLKPEGKIFFQVPFIIGYHPGPTDLHRFTKEGVLQILRKAGFHVEDIIISVAGATGFYRIAVEFFSILFSFSSESLYRPFKAFFAFFLYPIKNLDPIFRKSPQRDRIPGGYLAIAKKTGSDPFKK